MTSDNRNSRQQKRPENTGFLRLCAVSARSGNERILAGSASSNSIFQPLHLRTAERTRPY